MKCQLCPSFFVFPPFPFCGSRCSAARDVWQPPGIRLDACDVSCINYTPYKASRPLADIGGRFFFSIKGGRIDVNSWVCFLGYICFFGFVIV